MALTPHTYLFIVSTSRYRLISNTHRAWSGLCVPLRICPRLTLISSTKLTVRGICLRLVIWFILLFRSENFSSESSIKPVGSSKEKSSCVCFVLLINQFSYRKTIIVSAWSIDVRTKWSVRKSRVDPPGQERHKSWTAAVQHLFDRGLLLSSRYVLYMYDPVLPMVQMVREISVPYINVYYAKSCMVIIMLIIWNLNRK